MDQPAPRYVTISIDVDFQLSRIEPAAQYTLTSRLATLLENCRLPATWALPDPAKSVVLDRIAGTPSDQEVGVLGEPSWLALKMKRKELLAELMRRFGAARAMGLPVSTLALSGVSPPHDWDLLATNGIRVIRPPVTRTLGKSMPSKLPGGMWQIPASRVWPAARATLALAQAKHVVIQLSSLDGSAKELRQIDRYLQNVADGRDRGILRPETLRQQADRLTQQVPSGGSILRKAA